MVKILSLHLFAGIMLASLTYLRFTPKNYFRECDLKIITYSSFYEGAGKDLFAKYEEEFLCKLQVKILKTAGMLSQVKNLSEDYDVILGVDQYQMDDIDVAPFLLDQEDFHLEKYNIAEFNSFYMQGAFQLDSAPLTYFIRQKTVVDGNPYKIVSFFSFDDFLIFLKDQNIKIAVPSPSASVVGRLYLNWIVDRVKPAKEFLSEKNFVYVSSWTEAFGLFEKSLVGGFVTYETSQNHLYQQNRILIEKNKNSKTPQEEIRQAVKVEIQSGHPDYMEYFLISNASKASKEDKYRFVKFIYRSDNQELLFVKNYMWPVAYKPQEASHVRKIKVSPLKTRFKQKEILRLWEELK